ncbi:hypothetical protein UY416_19885 [Paenibacillus polymyxa]|uniref:hypothetical protein n=1 Tax=Paenibacillus polymyxa TaxID=1406 RepID=UPI002AB42C26|nr:hypothetical protein [Paenibacillus polymyxa]MDY8048553.1 hypothetical protein [Paenibacillus polymyxa]
MVKSNLQAASLVRNALHFYSKIEFKHKEHCPVDNIGLDNALYFIATAQGTASSTH